MTEQMRICPACHHGNLPDFRFCGRCGTALAPPETVPGTGETQQAAAAEAYQTPRVVESAGFSLRIIAFMIDGAIVFGTLVILNVVINLFRSFSYGYFDPWDLLYIPYQNPLLLLIAPAYYWLLTGLRGQTLGKMAVRIHVVTRPGVTPRLGKAALRELLAKPVLFLLAVGPPLVVAGFVLISLAFGGDMDDIPVALWFAPIAGLLGFAGFLWAIWDSENQGWHDKLAGTYVVRTARRIR